MRKIGKLLNYDENFGNIIDINGEEYIALKKEFLDNNIKNNDYVKFNAEKYKTLDNEYNVARFIEKYELEKEDYKSL